MKKDYRISEVVSESFSLMNKNWLPMVWYVFLWSVAMLSLSQLFDVNKLVKEFYGGNVTAEGLIDVYAKLAPYELISYVVSLLAVAALSKMALDAVNGKKVELNSCVMPVKNYVNFAVTCILVGVINSVGLMCCILPGIFLTVKLTLAPFYTIDKGMSITDALKASWNDTSGNWWHLFGSLIVMAIIMMIGYLLCCVGALYTFGVGFIISALLYKVISGGRTE